MLITVDAIVLPADANYGKLKITVLNDGADFGGSPDTTVEIGVVGPLTTIKTITETTPDFDHRNPSPPEDYFIYVDMDTTTDGDFAKGNYTVSVFLKNEGTPTGLDEKTESNTFDFQPLVPQNIIPSVDVKMDCFVNKLIIEDQTNYGSYTISSRELRIGHPNIPNVATPADTTTADLQITVDISYEYVAYDITLDVDVSTQSVDGNFTYNLLENVTYYESKDIVCDVDLCDLIDCIDKINDDFYAKAQKAGGVSEVSDADKDLYLQLMTTLSLYNNHVYKKSARKQQSLYEQLKALIFDCDCDCDTPTQPRILSTPDGTVYITGDSAYQVWLDEGNSGTEADFLASLNVAGAWTLIGPADYDSDYQQASGNGVYYRLLNGHVEFKGAFTKQITAGAAPIPSKIKIFENTLVIDVDTEGRIPVWNETAGCVGSFYRDTDGAWYIDAVSGYNNTDDQRITGQLPLNP